MLAFETFASYDLAFPLEHPMSHPLIDKADFGLL